MKFKSGFWSSLTNHEFVYRFLEIFLDIIFIILSNVYSHLTFSTCICFTLTSQWAHKHFSHWIYLSMCRKFFILWLLSFFKVIRLSLFLDKSEFDKASIEEPACKYEPVLPDGFIMVHYCLICINDISCLSIVASVIYFCFLDSQTLTEITQCIHILLLLKHQHTNV